ncbi:LysR family transcriptional regulator [Allobranchiibius huperziae]|uniref:DNA-binding transcriptional LysR family regulator n=1 Tax=Allobranchiibius huperziae TaxID=1874116 RepID=A0A853D6N0_9MICO|nr:LysR family transcriptional regulator [Allobranchiibius huperziae]NYJ73046.1 DNA-binding transcriptional LysR family regulator [Allobranchiibius huperziae]
MLDVNRLRVFRAVVASGSVQAAALNLGYTPSAISQHVSALQRETGLQLFEKSGRGISATPTGRALAAQSDEVMNNLARLDGVVDDLREGRTGTLAISCFASAGEQWIPLVARSLQRDFPDVQFTVDLNEQPSPTGPGRPDIDVRTEQPEDPPTRVNGYTRYELTEEPYWVVFSSDNPLAELGVVPMSALADHRWVMDNQDDDVCGRIVRGATRAAGFTPRYSAQTVDHHTSIAFAAAGIGVAVIPQLALGVLPADACSRPIADPAPRRRIVVFVRDNASANPAVARTLQLLRDITAPV